ISSEAIGKHKYARFMINHLLAVHYEYPEGLKKAVIYGGEGSNRTVVRIIKESILIQIFRDVHLTFEKNLVLSHLTTQHSAPDMTKTLTALLQHLAQERTHEKIPKRKSYYSIPNWMEIGQNALWSAAEVDEVEGAEEDITLEDVTVEIAA
ncbi:hypothetical protein PHLCEN_2v7712, partial [Hermanssonia centrifuga]